MSSWGGSPLGIGAAAMLENDLPGQQPARNQPVGAVACEENNNNNDSV